jgi:CRP/FNR family transcriptional regulator
MSNHDVFIHPSEIPLFSALTKDELRLIDQSKLIVQFRKGETIRKQGTFMSHVLIITEGLAKLYLEGEDHRNDILRIVKPPNFIGGPGIYLDNLHHFSVSAITQTTVCFIDVHIFRELVDQNQLFSHEFMKDFSANVLSVYRRLLNISHKQMPGRMADTILYLADEIFNSDRFPMLLSRLDLAELSGMSKDGAVKTLRDFQQDGMIYITDKEFLVKNHMALQRVSKLG